METLAVNVLVAEPRGFCAGVHRAIEIVELALERYGAPVYVRHEIVHSRHVVDSLRKKGAIFVEELDEVPQGAVVIFSAHGVARAVMEEASHRKLHAIDATCPLVTKVHMEARRHSQEGWEIVLIGHAGHPEVIGTMGQVPDGCLLVGSVKDVEALVVKNPARLAYVTQTTLSVDETQDIIGALKRRFPAIQGPNKEDICYATQNRQNAVKALSHRVDLLLVIGSPNSSNSNRLRELGERYKIPSYLIETVADIKPEWLDKATCVGITAGASAPEVLVQNAVAFLRRRNSVTVEEFSVIEEDVVFQLPAELTRPA